MVLSLLRTSRHGCDPDAAPWGWGYLKKKRGLHENPASLCGGLLQELMQRQDF
jgi:hypothetical protein